MQNRFGHPAVDADGHVMEPPDLWLRNMPASLRDRAPQPIDGNPLFFLVDGCETTPRQAFRGQEHRYDVNIDADRYRPGVESGFSARAQLAAMDVEGIDAAMLFPSLGLGVMGVAGAHPEITTAAARVYNDWVADFCSVAPHRLLGAGMIDPRDVDGAVSEARRCVGELGLPSVFLRPNPVDARNWHDGAYEPLWSAVEELGIPVCFHEGSAVTLPQVASDRYDVHAFWHACTHPMEQQMAMLSVVLGAVAERHPSLRFAFLESGAGWLPYWMWRLDESIEVEGREFPELKLRPSEYVQRQCFVSMDTDEHTGISAIDAFNGDAHVIWGSDYPHPDAKYPAALTTLSNVDGMTPERLRSVLFDAPVKLLGSRLERALAVAA
jgi:predicted TIM-barrel fold metal-dependent hydrolase